MDDPAIGKIMAAGLIGLVLWGVFALLEAKSEVARRARLVIAWALVLAVGAFLLAALGPLGLGAVLVVLGVIVWVVRGTKS